MPESGSEKRPADTNAPKASEQRRQRRFACVDGSRLKLSVCPEFRCRRGSLVDVSSGGIGIVLEEQLAEGTRVVFEVLSSAGTPAMSRTAKVRHSRPHNAPEDAPWLPPTPPVSRFFRNLFGLRSPEPAPKAWFTGCQFDSPLEQADVERLLAMLQAPPECFE